MELIIAFTIISLIFSFSALVLSIYNTIHIQAQKLSTHTVLPISQTNNMENIEKELENIVKQAGGNQEDLNRNLFAQGLDPEDLV